MIREFMKPAAGVSIVLTLTLASACTCAKKEAKAPSEPPRAETPAEVPSPAEAEAETEDTKSEEPTEPAQAAVARTKQAEAALKLGSPTQNLTGILGATVLQLKLAQDAEHAATVLDNILYTYNVAELRKQEKAAQDAGQKVRAGMQRDRKSLEVEYKTLEAKFAAENSPQFAQVSKVWNEVWGLN
jgi:hypothetical protein